MITVVAMTEHMWIEPDSKLDYRQWDHLCRNYRAELVMQRTLDDIVAMDIQGPIVVWEESAELLSTEFQHPETATYVFGRSNVNRIQEAFPGCTAVRIDTPAGTPCLFGVSAAAIALEERHRQGCGRYD